LNSYALSPPANGTITLAVTGEWSIREGLPSAASLQQMTTQAPRIERLVIDTSGLRKWDSALLGFLFVLQSICNRNNIAINAENLPAGAQRLMRLASAGPQRKDADGRAPRAHNLVWRLGDATLDQARGLREPVEFIGASLIAFARFFIGRARCRRSDLFLTTQECGAQALPIVSVISLLVGMIFAFVGAIQLKQFGADIYNANLVAVAMAREMAAVMTGIVLTGRTGAAFAAQIGAMQGNEEIDALSTLGISPMEFLVLPRMLALIVMMPLLCVYSNALGIFGGYVVSIGTLNVTSTAYLLQTQQAVTLTDFGIGIFKGAVFGIVIAITGCFRGMRAGRSAAAVGAATTSAVVSGILAIIVIDAIFAVLLNILGL